MEQLIDRQVGGVDTGFQPVLAERHKLRPGEIYTRTLPEAPGGRSYRDRSALHAQGRRGRQRDLAPRLDAGRACKLGRDQRRRLSLRAWHGRAQHDLALATLFDRVSRHGD
jgi:hypothetical protein